MLDYIYLLSYNPIHPFLLSLLYLSIILYIVKLYNLLY
nr:MAG TPA: hypothetical protein [Caudoviricetes sp.]